MSRVSRAVWYSYAIVKVVPRVERGECINAGVILFAPEGAYLAARIELDRERLRALDPDVHLEPIEQHLASFEAIARGDPSAGPIAALPPAERFHWLSAPRSTIIQTTPAHVGVTADPAATVEELLQAFVRTRAVGHVAHAAPHVSPTAFEREDMVERSPLLPDPAEMGRAWRAMVEAEYQQVERVREWQDSDYYAPIAQHFADDPYRTDDPLLEHLIALSRPDATWLDIGAGGGRYALPLALHSARVIAIEPSEGMRGVLRASMAEYGITNIDVRDNRWPDGADEVRVDFSLAAHVGYDIRDINAFIDGMERATRELCCVMLMDRAPAGGFVRLWELVHEEPRHQLPSMREFLAILLARGATPEVRLARRPPHAMQEDDIRANARRRLWLREGSAKDQRLQHVLDASLREHVDDYQLPRVIGLITWEPLGG
jgi:hypothetical protein